METEVEQILASGRGERAAPGWAAVMLVATLAGFLLLAGCANPQPPTGENLPAEAETPGPEGPDGRSDAAAVTVAQRMLEALGGWEAWQQTRYLRFGFVVERDGEPSAVPPQHLWDRWTGDYRVEGIRRIGEEETMGMVLFNVQTMDGSAYTRDAAGNWQAVDDDELAGWLDWGNGRFTNDTYWLLMPYKLQDPGVILESEVSETIDEVEYRVVHLSFDNAGRSPGDQYWAFIHPETWLMERWAYILEGQEPPRVEWAWTEWGPYGRLMLSRTKVLQDPQRQMRIIFEPLAVLESVDEEIFSNPDLPLPSP